MRRTILPDGKFYRRWQTARAILSLLTSLLGPIENIYSPYIPSMRYVLTTTYFISLFDLYLKLHVCYYNKYGILVTHPSLTAGHYITHSLVLDLVCVMPFTWILYILGSDRKGKGLHVLNFNVVVQMYRFPNIFMHMKDKIYRQDTLFYQFFKCAPFTFVIINLLACILMYISGEDTTINGAASLKPTTYCWLTHASDMKYLNLNESYIFYTISLYYTTIMVSGLSYNLFNATNVNEAIFVIVCILIGYMIKMYNTANIAHTRFTMDQKLTQHRNYMVQLVKFMREEHLPKDMQCNIIEYFEHNWRKMQGVTPSHIYSLLHYPLKMDFVCHLFQNTLQKVPVFVDANNSFYRHIGVHLHADYFLKDSNIIKLNDIVDKVYIIHCGEAVVLGPDNSLFCTLRRGSMFGNIDNASCTRSMVTVSTSQITEVFIIDTMTLYKLFSEYKYIGNKLQHYILLDNSSYIEGSTGGSSTIEQEVLDDNISVEDEIPFISGLIEFMKTDYMIPVMVLVDIISCLLSAYQMAFLTAFSHTFILYFFDFLHCVNIVLIFFTPYYDNRGEFVTNQALIRKRYLHSVRFYVDALTVFPYDIFAYFLNDVYHCRVLFGIYRVIRVVNIRHYFKTSVNAFGVKIIVFRMTLMILYAMVVVHVCACLSYSWACPFQKCQMSSWVYFRRQYVCKDEYICSVYLVISALSTTGFAGRVSTTLTGMLVNVFVIVIVQYFLATIVGDLIALIRNATYSLAQYDFDLTIFIIYLENRYVSLPFLERMQNYCKSLWVIGRGSQLPTYLLRMPSFLLEGVKMHAYGKHILQNVIFENCHKDFLRLLIAKLNVQNFFAGDTICHQEDIDNTMYFIHRGTVNVYSVTAHEESHVDALKVTDSFGLIQGLYPNTPHTHTYKASAVTRILSLDFNDWSILLQFYPASKFEIYSNMSTLFLVAASDGKKGEKSRRKHLFESVPFKDKGKQQHDEMEEKAEGSEDGEDYEDDEVYSAYTI